MVVSDIRIFFTLKYSNIRLYKYQGRSQEFEFTEAKLKGKGTLCPPEADAIHQSQF